MEVQGSCRLETGYATLYVTRYFPYAKVNWTEKKRHERKRRKTYCRWIEKIKTSRLKQNENNNIYFRSHFSALFIFVATYRSHWFCFAGPVRNIQAVVHGTASLPCDIATPKAHQNSDTVILVVWYRNEKTAIYRQVFALNNNTIMYSDCCLLLDAEAERRTAPRFDEIFIVLNTSNPMFLRRCLAVSAKGIKYEIYSERFLQNRFSNALIYYLHSIRLAV